MFCSLSVRVLLRNEFVGWNAFDIAVFVLQLTIVNTSKK